MSSQPSAQEASDRRSDRAVLLAVAGTIMAAFSAGASVQSMFVYSPPWHASSTFAEMLPEFAVRFSINLCSSALALVCCALFAVERRSPWTQALFTVAASVVVALLRYGLHLVIGIDSLITENALISLASTTAVGTIAVGMALVLVRTRQRLRQRERDYARQEARASAAVTALMAEELRVRRMVAEKLHGTVQSRIVYVQAGIDRLAARLDDGRTRPADAAALRRLRADLDEIRERDVRELSTLLYPASVSIGIAHALRVLVRQVPETIDIAVNVDPRVSASDSLDVARRVAIVRAAEEGITNALRHGRAGRIRLELRAGDAVMLLTVDDDGRGLADHPHWEGLARISETVTALGGTVSLSPSTLGGARLAVTVGTDERSG